MSEKKEGDFLGELMFQSEESPRSLTATGKMYADVDPVTGGFATWVGDHPVPIKVPIYNARGLNKKLDENGFQLVEHNIHGIDFYNEDQILREYYPAVASFLQNTLGAFKIGGPSTSVHGDYGMRGGPVRVKRLALPPAVEDSFTPLYGETPLISPEEMKELEGRRFAVVNLWRSFTKEPCVDKPLTFCDIQTTKKEDYATMETRYQDKTIDVYLGGHSPGQKWYYYPELLSNEGVLLKTYDSQGELFAEFDIPERIPNLPLVSASSVLHTAVEDPRITGTDYPKRQSIEVRCAVFY